ncbi:MAG: GSCFA domain-containing protein [Bacteroidales bacterium]
MSASFFTPVNAPKFTQQIDYHHKMLFIGSCFANSMAERMQVRKFSVGYNPFGVLYNPKSIANAIERMSERIVLTEGDLNYEHNLWFSYTHHSKFSHANKSECLRRINQSVQKGAWALRTADFLLITLGSAIVYQHKVRGEIVANCHKSLKANFEVQLLSVKEVHNALEHILQTAHKINPSLRIIFTVSPIRYSLADMHQNQISKASLLLGLHDFLQRHSECFYFPAYEIMLDELRDYRFYKADMQHPNDIAVEHIWQKFVQIAIAPTSLTHMKKIESMLAVKQHHPFNPSSPDYAELLRKQTKVLEELASVFPHIDWREEKAFFSPTSM